MKWMGFGFAFLGTALFSFKSIFIKLAYAQGLDTDSVLMLRMALSLPLYMVIMVVLFHKGQMPVESIKQRFIFIVFLGFIGYFLASWLDLKGLETISAGLERLTLFIYPIFVAVLGALFFKVPMNKKIIVTLILTYTGIWIIFNQESMGATEVYKQAKYYGVFSVLLAALSYSFYVLFGRKIIAEIGSLWFTALAMSVSSIFVLFYYMLRFDVSTLHITYEAWLWVVLLAVVSTVLPSFMISEAVARIGPTKTGIVGTLGPIVTIILAVFILDEPFGMAHFVGIVFVVAGVLLLTTDK